MSESVIRVKLLGYRVRVNRALARPNCYYVTFIDSDLEAVELERLMNRLFDEPKRYSAYHWLVSE